MWNISVRIIILLCFGLVWIDLTYGLDKDYATCSFNYWKMDWSSAWRTCEKGGRRLLCYSTKKEIDDITEAFRLAAYGNAELEMWLSSKNCSDVNRTEECLSLHIRKSAQKLWHYFQEDCRKHLPFVCCVKDTGVISDLTADPTFTTMPVTAVPSSASLLTSLEFPSTAKTLLCSGKIRRGIAWPDTPAGSIAIENCPRRATGRAHWFCKPDGHWSRRGPNLRDCRSLDISKWREKFNQTNLNDTLSQLEEMLGDHQGDMFGKDLSEVVLTMSSLPDHILDHAATVDDGALRWSTIRAAVQRSAAIFDTIVSMEYSWRDIEQQMRSEVGSSLLATVDGMGVVLADAMHDGTEEENIINTHLALQVVRPPFPGAPLLLPRWSAPLDHPRGDILLQGGYEDGRNATGGKLSVVFVLYTDLSAVLQLDSDDNQSLPRLNSAVVSAVVAQDRLSVPVSSPVRVRVEHLRADPNGTAACVFWNTRSNAWDTSGCRLESGNSTYSVCACDHLTNFAVLMDYAGNMDQVDQLPFFYITVIGCSISIVCLAICVAIFSCYSYHSKHSWGLRYTIHRNLCLSLLVANFVLVVGLDKTDNAAVCSVVAGLLHYFFLSAFSWMLLEGVHIYLLLVVVFAARRSHWEKFYLFGYGFPLIVVAVTAIVRPTYYGTDEVCWLSVEKGTIWAFMAPVAFILVVNTAALLLAQWKASKVSAKDDNIALVKRWLRVTLILFPVLGITWVFGFLYVGEHFEVAGYLFAILNSMQGFCIFVCHCLMDKKARNMVLASFKKKTASVTTGSSGTAQRKPKDDANGAKKEHAPAITCANADEVIIVDAKSQKWAKWRKPWSFFFEMPVTEASAPKDNQVAPTAPPMDHVKDRAV